MDSPPNACQPKQRLVTQSNVTSHFPYSAALTLRHQQTRGDRAKTPRGCGIKFCSAVLASKYLAPRLIDRLSRIPSGGGGRHSGGCVFWPGGLVSSALSGRLARHGPLDSHGLAWPLTSSHSLLYCYWLLVLAAFCSIALQHGSPSVPKFCMNIQVATVCSPDRRT